MKEITRIHLASIPFNIEVDAKKSLEKYLASVEKSLGADKDTIREIEARMAEILNERGVVGEKVITSDDLMAVTEQLGEPEAFVDETALDAERATFRSPRKLYRDADNAMLAGVFSGVAAYFKIDATIVRLIGVILLFVTAGAMVPVYIVLAVVMPVAKTAAQKLQMAGEPVTLESLKEQTASTLTNENRGMLLRVIMILVGVGFTISAVGSLIGLGYATFASSAYVLSDEWPVVLAAFALGFAGMLFVALMVLLAYASFTMKFTKKIGYSLLAVTLTGLILGSIGGFGLGYQVDHVYRKATIEKRLDGGMLVGVKKVVVNSEFPIYVNYTVQSKDAPLSATYSHYTMSDSKKEKIVLKNVNGVLEINAPKGSEAPCEYPFIGPCGTTMTVTITGPELEAIEVSKENSMYYQAPNGQSKLLVEQEGPNSMLTLQSSRPIADLSALISGGAILDATEANVENITANVLDSLSSIDVARVKTLQLTIPESCAQTENQGELEIRSASQITINGKPYQADAKYLCASINVGGNENEDN